MDNQEQKNIIISSVEELGWGLKITDEKGLKYNVSEKKKDGTTTKAFTYLKALPKNGLGLNKCFKFNITPNNQGGNSRWVTFISEPQEEGQPTTYVSPKMEKSKPVVIEKETTDWDKISWGKCKHAYLVEAYKWYFNNSQNIPDLKNGLKLIEETAEQWADMSMRRLNDKKEIEYNEDIPMPEDDDIDTGSIPF